MTGNTSAVRRLEIDEYNNIMVDLPVTHPLSLLIEFCTMYAVNNNILLVNE